MTTTDEVLMPANAQDRLDRIAEFHQKKVDAGGGTWGDCNECGWSWPCPTYQWATAPANSVSMLCTWDLSDCSFESHNQHAASEPSQTSATVDDLPADRQMDPAAQQGTDTGGPQ